MRFDNSQKQTKENVDITQTFAFQNRFLVWGGGGGGSRDYFTYVFYTFREQCHYFKNNK